MGLSARRVVPKWSPAALIDMYGSPEAGFRTGGLLLALLSARRYRDGWSALVPVPPTVGFGRNFVAFVCGLIAKLGKAIPLVGMQVAMVCSLVPMVRLPVAAIGHSRSGGGSRVSVVSSLIPGVGSLIPGVGLGGSQLQIDFSLICRRVPRLEGPLTVVKQPRAPFVLRAADLVVCHTSMLRVSVACVVVAAIPSLPARQRGPRHRRTSGRVAAVRPVGRSRCVKAWSGHPVVQAWPDRAAPAWPRWSALPDESQCQVKRR